MEEEHNESAAIVWIIIGLFFTLTACSIAFIAQG